MARDGSGSNFNPTKPAKNHPWRRQLLSRDKVEWAKEQSFQPIIKDYTKKKGQF